jgi:hypothetical protein
MDSEKIDYSSDLALLRKLKRILNYQISTWLLFMISFLFISPILIVILAVAALLFAFYIIFALYKNHKYGWIAAFFITTIIPVIILAFIVELNYSVIILLIIEVAAFFIYCAALRLTVNLWVKEIESKRLFDYRWKKEIGL